MAINDLTPKKDRQGQVVASAILSLIISGCLLWAYVANKETFGAIRLDTLFATIIAAIPLYTVWRFRNEDKQQDIINAQVETQIPDFHQVEKWATNAEPDKTPESLRIAAIHQLRPYLEGEHGDAFQRPAYEIYKALLANWDNLERDTTGKLTNKALDELNGYPIPPYIEAIHTVIREILRKEGNSERVFPVETRPLWRLNLLGCPLIDTHLDVMFH